MPQYIKQALLTVFFAGQLATVWYLNKTDTPQADLGEKESLRRYGFHLRECARECGIDFTHESPAELDEKLSHIMPIIASMGASVTAVDFDKDGWIDLYVVTSKEGGKNRLYRNKGDGTFEDVAEKMGVADLNKPGTGVCQGAVWGDFDNDGYEDLFIYKWGKPELFRNIKGKRFERVTDTAGLPKWLNANSACWLDYDGDGKLDLFIAGYWPDDLNLWNLSTSKMMPESFQHATNGGKKHLLRNLGGGKFKDVTEEMGITSTRWTLGVQAADLCGTGYPDIVLANDYGVSEFLCNKNGQAFEEIGQKTRIGDKPKSGMNVTLGDIFNQGQFSIYITNISEKGVLVQGNNLWVPRKHTPGQPPEYINQAEAMNVHMGGWSWGSQFGDLNNDGYQDLYLTNGYISADRNQSYWYDYGLIASGNKIIISDARNWPAIKDSKDRIRSLSGYQQKCLWLNRRGEFAQVAQAVGVKDTFDGRAVVLADLFNRGVLDVVVANQNGPLLIYKNTVAKGRDWVQFDLEGTRSNKSAIGALVRVFWTMKGEDRVQEQVQVVSGGNGYASQNMRRLHFGLGEKARIEKVTIQWPGGKTQTLTSVALNKIHSVKEKSR